MRCLIVDDEELSRVVIESLVKKTDFLELVASCTSPLEAASVLRTGAIDILFADVEMSEMTGLELIRSLDNPPEVILVTAKEQYAVDAFEMNVADYLVKPVTLPRFLKAVNRVRERLQADTEVKQTSDAIFIKVNSQLVNIRLADILWVEATGDYVTLNTLADKYIVHSTMKGIEHRLPNRDFVRVHRSYIVRIDRIKAIEDTLIIIGKNLIPIGDSYRTPLMNRLTTL